MDVTACILGDIIKPGDKLRNTPGVLEGANYGNRKQWLFLNIFFSMLKSGVDDEDGLCFCTWMNYLTSPLMSNACEVKAGIIKGDL